MLRTAALLALVWAACGAAVAADDGLTVHTSLGPVRGMIDPTGVARVFKGIPYAAPPTGPHVYNAVCIACHAAPGIGGAPALGDVDAWAARIAQGMETLIDHALRGFSGSTGVMPRKGGRVDLSDEEIIGAVEYMVEQVAQ